MVRTTYGPARLSVVLDVGSVGPLLQPYRIVRSDQPDDPVFINSFRSNYDLGSPPRLVEDSAAVIHMGISMYLDRRVAEETARRFRKLGDYLARVDLRSGFGFNYAVTGHKSHLTIWGDPVKLSTAVVDVYTV